MSEGELGRDSLSAHVLWDTDCHLLVAGPVSRFMESLYICACGICEVLSVSGGACVYTLMCMCVHVLHVNWRWLACELKFCMGLCLLELSIFECLSL